MFISEFDLTRFQQRWATHAGSNQIRNLIAALPHCIELICDRSHII